jgi:hypothetical protein
MIYKKTGLVLELFQQNWIRKLTSLISSRTDNLKEETSVTQETQEEV